MRETIKSEGKGLKKGRKKEREDKKAIQGVMDWSRRGKREKYHVALGSISKQLCHGRK